MVEPALLCPSSLSASPGLTLRLPTTMLRLPRDRRSSARICGFCHGQDARGSSGPRHGRQYVVMASGGMLYAYILPDALLSRTPSAGALITGSSSRRLDVCESAFKLEIAGPPLQTGFVPQFS